MSQTFPVAYPSQGDAGTPQWNEQFIANTTGDAQTIVVPGGEQWLMSVFCARLQSSGAAGNRFGRLDLFDADGQRVYRLSIDALHGATETIWYTWGLGLSDQLRASTVPSVSTFHVSGALPWVVAPTGWSWVVTIVGAGGGDAVNGTTITYAWWDNVPATPPPLEQAGPFMFVPGPNTV